MESCIIEGINKIEMWLQRTSFWKSSIYSTSKMQEVWPRIWPFCRALWVCMYVKHIRAQLGCLWVSSNHFDNFSYIFGLRKVASNFIIWSICKRHWWHSLQYWQSFIFFTYDLPGESHQWPQFSRTRLKSFLLSVQLLSVNEIFCRECSSRRTCQKGCCATHPLPQFRRKVSELLLIKTFITWLQNRVIDLEEYVKDLKVILEFLDSRMVKQRSQVGKAFKLRRKKQ